MRRICLLFTLIAETGIAGTHPGPLRAQQSTQASAEKPRMDVSARFRGIVKFRGPNGSSRSVQVTIQNWDIPNLETVSSFPLKGYMVMELRGGGLTTVINGEQTERETGSFWVVPERARLSLITEKHTVALQVTAIRPAPAR